MGNILNIQCNNCGYNKPKNYVGGGMRNHTTYDGVLALNAENSEVEVINNFDFLKNLENKFSIYKPYYNSEMFKNDGNEGDTGHWGNIKYKVTGNYCPKCKEYEMEISKGGLWD